MVEMSIMQLNLHLSLESILESKLSINYHYFESLLAVQPKLTLPNLKNLQIISH